MERALNRYVKKFVRLFFTVGLILIVLAVIGVGAIALIRRAGKNSIFNAGAIKAPGLTSEETLSDEEKKNLNWQDDYIIYHRGVYDYNDDIMTFLIMGIDKTEDSVSKVYGEIDGGQADALFLLVVNPHDKSVKIISVNRNTMTDVDIYDEYGNYLTTRKAQIAVQHGFGDGVEGSCELQKKAVSKLFYSLPIHGYAAINMSAIPAINDSVGGVDVTPAYDFEAEGYSFKKGETVHLVGDMAFAYLHERDVTLAGSADLRQQRHKEYLRAFVGKAKTIVRDNPLALTSLYEAVQKQMITDISAQEVFFLSTVTNGYSFEGGNFYTMEGVTSIGPYFEEFYADDDALMQMMVDIFYEKVGEY